MTAASVRRPVVAGLFYPARPDEMERVDGNGPVKRCAMTRITPRPLLFGALLALLSGCVSVAQQEAARAAWEANDQLAAARCPGRSIDGACISGGP
jgi:hypothetical protein